MRILHVINIYYSLAYLGDQFKYFSIKGYEQHLACSPSVNLSAYSIDQKIQCIELEIKRKISLIKDLIAVFKICKYIHKNRIQIIVGHTPKGALLAMLSGYIMRVPIRIYYRHGIIYETMFGLKRKLMINIDRLTAFCSTNVVVVSNYVYEKSILDNLNPSSKQQILGKGTCGGIDSKNKFNPQNINSKKLELLREKYNISTDSTVIGYCGRLVKDKGITELVNSFSILNKKQPYRNYILLLVGSFDNRDVLPQKIVNEIEQNQNIIVTGFIFKEIEYYYALMDLFILPSYREGFGMAVIEASSMEVPVLATDTTGCAETLVENLTGFYIKNSVDGIIEGIQKIMLHKNTKELGKNGREFVLKNFDNDELWPIIESKLYKQLN